MSVPAAIVLGILIGWLIEWVIDWIYWRRKQPVQVEFSQYEELKREHETLKSRFASISAAPDDLKVIKGIGPEIERLLNQAGISTFAQLGELTPAGLESILGAVIKRLSNEQSILDQARELAKRKG